MPYKSLSILAHNFLNVDKAEILIQLINLSLVLWIHYLLCQFSSFLYNFSISSGQAMPDVPIVNDLSFIHTGVNVSLNKLFAINPQGSALAF